MLSSTSRAARQAPRTCRACAGEIVIDVDEDDNGPLRVRRCRDCGRARALRPPPRIGDDGIMPLGAPIRTGWAGLDAALGGGLAAGLAVVAAPPGTGKTSWCVQLADQVSATRPVVYVAAEPSIDEVRARLAAPRLARPWRDILLDGDPRVGDVLRDIDIHARPDLPSAELLDALADDAGVDPVIVVDHVHALARRRARHRDEVGLRSAVGDLSLELADLAARRRTVVVAAAQVARTWYAPRADDAERSGRDFLAAAKESGEIECDASYLLYVIVDGDRARIEIAKARYSASDISVPMRVDLAIGRWGDAPAEDASGTARSRTRSQSRPDRDVAAQILDLIRRHGPKPRKYLVRALRCRDAAVYNAVTELLARGALVEVPSTGTRADGRPYHYTALALAEAEGSAAETGRVVPLPLPALPPLPGSGGSDTDSHGRQRPMPLPAALSTDLGSGSGTDDVAPPPTGRPR